MLSYENTKKTGKQNKITKKQSFRDYSGLPPWPSVENLVFLVVFVILVFPKVFCYFRRDALIFLRKFCFFWGLSLENLGCPYVFLCFLRSGAGKY